VPAALWEGEKKGGRAEGAPWVLTLFLLYSIFREKGRDAGLASSPREKRKKEEKENGERRAPSISLTISSLVFTLNKRGKRRNQACVSACDEKNRCGANFPLFSRRSSEEEKKGGLQERLLALLEEREKGSEPGL